MNSVYQINKGINKQIEFKGLKAQYIAYLAVGLVLLLILFAVLYITGVNMYICLFVVGMLGTMLYTWVTKFSRKYGRYGLMKKAAKKGVPAYVRFHSRKIFSGLQKNKQNGTGY
jgi:O-antigen/teichoic acid export membrane protein